MAVKSRSRRLVYGLLFLVAVAAGFGAVYGPDAQRVYRVNRLFDADVIVENFRSMDAIFPSRVVASAATPSAFELAPAPLPQSFRHDGLDRSVSDFLSETWTTGLIVLVDGKIAYEDYYLGNNAGTKTISWSMSKSIVSALAGIAVAEGHIRSLGDRVTDYVPALAGSGYDQVSIEDVLTMSSGVRFNEDYGDFNSDINRMGRAIAFGTSIDEFVASLAPERPPGTYNHYVSMDTQVIAMVLREATGESLSSYMESRLWRRIGTESAAYWLIDRDGMELAFGGLNAVLRDYARVGQLYLQQGQWDGVQVVPAEWVYASLHQTAARLQPGRNPSSNSLNGYGYQWWIPEGAEGEFLAQGHSNQFIYVNPARRVVIAKSSAYPDYGVDGMVRERESLSLFRAIAESVSP